MQLIKLAVVKTLLDKQKQRVQTKQIHKASLSQAVRHWQKNELAGTFGAFRRLLAASPTANMQSLATQAGASPAHRVVDEESPATEGSWELLDIWDDRADMMEAIDAYYAKRSVTARFEDWKKRRMRVKRLKTTEEGQRAGDLIRSLRSLADDRRRAATAVQQGAQHWAKGGLHNDKSYWAPRLFTKLKAKRDESHVEESLLALAQSHRQRTLLEYQRDIVEDLRQQCKTAARVRAVSECDPAKLAETVGIQLPLAKYRAQVAMVDEHYHKRLRRRAFMEWALFLLYLAEARSRSRSSSEVSSLSPRSPIVSPTSPPTPGEFQEAILVASNLLNNFRTVPQEAPAKATNSARGSGGWADVVRSKPENAPQRNPQHVSQVEGPKNRKAHTSKQDAAAIYMEGSGDVSPQEIERRAEAGDAESQFLLGCLHARRWQAACHKAGRENKKRKAGSKPKDGPQALQSKAMAWLERAARQRHQNAMLTLAQIGLDQHVAGEVQERAVQWLRQAAELGMPSAQALLGEMYGKGYISTDGNFWLGKDYNESARWLKKAAEADIVSAQFALCCLYTEGWGVSQDDEQAKLWLKRAANNGHAQAKGILTLNAR